MDEQQRVLENLVHFFTQHNECQQKQFDAAKDQILALQSNNQQLSTQLSAIQTALNEANRLQKFISESVSVQLPANIEAMSQNENQLSIQTKK